MTLTLPIYMSTVEKSDSTHYMPSVDREWTSQVHRIKLKVYGFRADYCAAGTKFPKTCEGDTALHCAEEGEGIWSDAGSYNAEG